MKIIKFWALQVELALRPAEIEAVVAKVAFGIFAEMPLAHLSRLFDFDLMMRLAVRPMPE